MGTESVCLYGATEAGKVSSFIVNRAGGGESSPYMIPPPRLVGDHIENYVPLFLLIL